jgi:hypothetical protein
MGQNHKIDEIDRKRKHEIMLSPEAIDGEIQIWESIKSCDYSQKSDIFRKYIDVDSVLKQLYKAKQDNKVVQLDTLAFYLYYLSEEEKRKLEEERKKREEERKKREEEERKYREMNKELNEK